MMKPPPYPLNWPSATPRTSFRVSWKSNVTMSAARNDVLDELRKMRSYVRDSASITSNLLPRLDGLPRSGQAEPADPGVAVYWLERVNGAEVGRCMAIDRYTTTAGNLRAIALSIGAIRGLERWGGDRIAETAMSGFLALPAPSAEPEWWRVLLFDSLPRSTPENLDTAMRVARDLMGTLHPDKGGDPVAFKLVSSARDKARSYFGAGR